MKNKKKDLLLIIFVVLSIISSIGIIIHSIISYMDKDGFGFNSLALLEPFIFIPIVLIIIWGFYFILYIIKVIYTKIRRQ